MAGKHVKNGAALKKELTAILATVEGLTTDIITKLGFDGLYSLQQLTPRKTNFAASMWRVAINNPPSKKVKHPGGSSYIVPPPSMSQFTGVTLGDSIHLYNNTMYIKPLDKGSSAQATQGMIQPTYSRLITVARNLSKALSKKVIK